MIKAKFNIEQGILFVSYTEIITIYDIVGYINATKLNNAYPRNLRIISDARNAKFSLNPDDLETIITENNEALKRYNFIFDAILVDSPNETALAMLYQQLSKADNYKFELFLAKDNAENWLERMGSYYHNTEVVEF